MAVHSNIYGIDDRLNGMKQKATTGVRCSPELTQPFFSKELLAQARILLDTHCHFCTKLTNIIYACIPLNFCKINLKCECMDFCKKGFQLCKVTDPACKKTKLKIFQQRFLRMTTTPHVFSGTMNNLGIQTHHSSIASHTLHTL